MELSCSICHEEYTSNADISTTRCGHVFHTRCIQDWINRFTTCPVCQLSCAETIKIFLKFNNSPEEIEAIGALKSQLEQSLKNTSEIQHLLDQSEQNVLDLQEQIQIIQSELDLSHDQNEYLKIQTESKAIELAKKTNEIIKLREGVEQMSAINDSQSQNNKLFEELTLKDTIIKSLEEQLKTKSLELEKEIRNSTMHIYDKIKMQKLLDSYNENNSTRQNMNCMNDLMNSKKQNSDQQIKEPSFVSKTPENPLNKNLQSENTQKNFIRISGFQEINSPLEEIVVYLAKLMQIECKKEDIESVCFLPPQRNFQNNLKTEKSLMVNFKSNDLKTKFLTGKNKLNENPSTKSLRIFDQNHSTSKYELMSYTKKLKAIGFEFFFIKNGTVFARENKSSPFIKIYNKQQVDNMLKENEYTMNTLAEKVFDCGVQFSTI